ncbi:MAG: AsmA family protein, partial [gamma proteobacterium symbiont of Bathyaustriella thionipta]|nr:AsmA family protein [gamma proteobacterium symbiont of Bathyaustriella thionipta]
MAKLLKWIVGIVLTLLVVLIILAVSIKMLVDPNDYKAEITQAVQDATGRTLSLNGDIKLSVFPWLGLQLNQASLSNAKGFGEQPFAAVEHTSVNVKLIPLLSKQIQVDQIELQGLRLNLQKNKAGVSNWDDLSGKSEADTDSKPASNEKTAAGSQSLSIGGIQIEDAQISWNDAESGKKASLSGFNLKTGAIEAGESIDVEMSLSVDSNQPPLKADLSLEARFSMSADGQSFKMQPFELHLENVKTANDISLDVLIIAALEANQTAQSVHLSGLDVSLKAQGKGLPKGEMLASLQADVMADMSRQTVKVSGLKLSAAELQLNGELDAKNLSGQPDVSGQLKLAAFNLSQWMQDMGMPAPATSDPGVLQQVAFSTRVASKGQQVGFEDLLLTVDDTHMKGFIRLADLKKQALRFDLSVDAINLDRYLPPASEKATGKPASTEQPSASQELPLEQLRSLDINGVFRLGQLTVNKLKVADVVITLKADKGQITLDTVANKLYQGNARVNVKMNVNGKQPRFNISKRVNNFQLGPMLTDLTGKDTLTCTAHMKADLTRMGIT